MTAGLELNIQYARGIASREERVFVGLLQCRLQRFGLHIPAVDKEELVTPVSARKGGRRHITFGRHLAVARTGKKKTAGKFTPENVVNTGIHTPITGRMALFLTVFNIPNRYLRMRQRTDDDLRGYARALLPSVFMNFSRAGVLQNRSRTIIVVPSGQPAIILCRTTPPSIRKLVPSAAPLSRVSISTRATAATAASASPRKPSVEIASSPFSSRSLLVA